MAWDSAYTDYIASSTQNAGVDRSSFFTKEKLNNYLGKTGGTITEATYNADGSMAVKYQLTGKEIEYNFTIDENGNISIGEGSTTTVAEYGTTATLGTVTVNGTALEKGWKYFYNDGSNIYLIYDYYLEHDQIPTGGNITVSDGYSVYSTSGSETLINYLKNATIWNGFATGVTNALNAKGVTVSGLTVTGGPMVEMFQASYDTQHPDVGFKVSDNQSVTGASVKGYYYWTTAENSWKDYVLIENSNLLYFPEVMNVTDNGVLTVGYWAIRIFWCI